jgi:hypothetical protein
MEGHDLSRTRGFLRLPWPAGLQTAGREVRLSGVHVWSVLFAEDRAFVHWYGSLEEEESFYAASIKLG